MERPTINISTEKMDFPMISTSMEPADQEPKPNHIKTSGVSESTMLMRAPTKGRSAFVAPTIGVLAADSVVSINQP